MHDDRFDTLMRDLADEEPSFPPTRQDAVWERVVAALDRPRTVSRSGVIPLVRRVLPFAAVLLIGIGLGRFAIPGAGGAPALPNASSGAPAIDAIPAGMTESLAFAGIASDYLERTTGFLITLTAEVRAGRPLDASMPRARELLATTRLLLGAGVRDDPGAGPGLDPALRALLEDLELVLAQIVRLPAESRDPRQADARYIAETMDHRDVLPRLHVFLADARPLR